MGGIAATTGEICFIGDRQHAEGDQVLVAKASVHLYEARCRRLR